MISFHAKTQRRKGIRLGLAAALFLAAALHGFAQAGRIYTAPDPAATGSLKGRTAEPLTHAVAVERDRARVFRAALDDDGRAFRFERLPIGKYDLVLFTRTGTVYEGLALGETLRLEGASDQNFRRRIDAADGFFNKTQIHRAGLSADGETLLAFVERFRANDVLKQSGEALGQMVRRFEIVELTRAADDWQMSASRHIYREGEPVVPEFRKTVNLPALGNLRVVREPKDLGEIPLQNPHSPGPTGGIFLRTRPSHFSHEDTKARSFFDPTAFSPVVASSLWPTAFRAGLHRKSAPNAEPIL